MHPGCEPGPVPAPDMNRRYGPHPPKVCRLSSKQNYRAVEVEHIFSEDQSAFYDIHEPCRKKRWERSETYKSLQNKPEKPENP